MLTEDLKTGNNDALSLPSADRPHKSEFTLAVSDPL